jgi:hypothetical protein
MGEPMIYENRRDRRYAINGDVFVGARPVYQIVGRLRDISQGGASFEYIAGINQVPSKTVEVNIFCGRVLRLARIPCRVVYETQVDQPSLGGTGKRRCGLQFQRLTNLQRDLLHFVLSD